VGGGEPQFALEDEIASAGVADAADMWDEPAPPQAPEPTFTLDEAEAQQQPTIEVPVTTSAWDEDEVAPPVPAAAVPIPAPVPPAAPPPIPLKEEWGFDEAQIETAQRVHTPAKSTPVGAPIPKGKRKTGNRLGLLLAIMAVFVLGAGGYYGYLWWQERQEQAPAPVVERRPPLQPVTATTASTATAPPAATMTIVDATTTTTTAPPAKAPLQITATTPPPVETTTTAPLPTVTPKAPAPAPASGDRARYDEMARLYAANATGNFTVQIQILCEPSNLTKAISAGGEKVWFVPQSIGGRPCYRVFWGRYNTRDEAQRALGDVPASLRDRSSSVKAVPKG
jgi:hypothetical protein